MQQCQVMLNEFSCGASAADETAKSIDVLLYANDVSSLFLVSEFHCSLISLD